jgi:hypothetical protein
MKVLDYFGKRNEAYDKDEMIRRQSSESLKKKASQNGADENGDPQAQDGKDVNTTRQLNEERNIEFQNITAAGNCEDGITNDIATTSGNKTKHNLVLKEDNVAKENSPSTKENVILHDNFAAADVNKEFQTTIKTNSQQMRLLNAITLKDYAELYPNEINMFDLRSFLTYTKDELFIKHALLTVLFKKSILDPAVIRCTSLVLEICACFVANALTFTDSYIDKRSQNPFKVI